MHANWVQTSASVREFAGAFWRNWLARMSGGFSVPFGAAGIFFAESARAQTFWFALAGAALVVCAYFVWLGEHKRANALAERLRPAMTLIFKPAFPWVVPVERGRIQVAPSDYIEAKCLFFCVQIHNPRPAAQLRGVRVSLINVERLENGIWVDRGMTGSLRLRWAKELANLFAPRDIEYSDKCYVDIVSVDEHHNKVLIKQEIL
jgi:hypothetical protein